MSQNAAFAARALAVLLLVATFLAGCAGTFVPRTPAESFAYAESNYQSLLDVAIQWQQEGRLTAAQQAELAALFDQYEDARNAALTARRAANDVDFTNSTTAMLSVLQTIRPLLE